MRLLNLHTIFLLFLLCSTIVLSQDNIKSRQTELDKLRREIESIDKKIQDKEKKEKATVDLLDSYDKQANLVRKLIKTIQKQSDALEKDIAETRSAIRQLTSQLTFVKKQYAGYVSRLYKYGKISDLELLLTSQSVNQGLVRSEYLRKFSEQRKKDLDGIVLERDQIEKENIKLKQQLDEQEDLLKQKKKEDIVLADKMRKRKQVLAQIRKDKKSLQQEAERTAADAKKIEKLIAKLIEDDRIKREKAEAAAKANKQKPPSPSPVNSAFAAKRKSLPWPVSNGKVITRFGAQQNKQLGTITQNTGIDVSVPVGTQVLSVAEGEVSLISWLPSFGNLVIVDHAGGYRTVYSHLSEIFVNEGDQVSTSSAIGKSGESVAGPVVHFEIWKDREKQDPELWLNSRGPGSR